MAILIPSLSAAKKNAQASVCLNNLRQLGLGTAMYNQENNYCFPFPTTEYPLNSADYSTSEEFERAKEKMGWFTGLDDYLSSSSRDNTGNNAVGRRNYRKFKQCPVWVSLSTASAKPQQSTVQTIQQWSRTLKINTHLRRKSGSLYTLARVGDIEIPTDHVLFGDGSAPDLIPWNVESGEAGSMSMDTTDGTQGAPALRHNGGANIVFVDGHASTIRLNTSSRKVATGYYMDGWVSEWLSGNTPVSGSGNLSIADAYTRNPAMPLVWSIPGKLYR